MTPEADADYLVIGSGIAGLRAALALAGTGRILVLTKAEPTAGNTGYAQGGIAAAVDPADPPDAHLADTLAAGDGLCDEAAARVLTGDGPARVRELIAWGARFDTSADGALSLAREGGHSARRIVRADDLTGRAIERDENAGAAARRAVEAADPGVEAALAGDVDGAVRRPR